MSYTVLISGGADEIGVDLIKNIILNNSTCEIIILDNFITSDPDSFDLIKNNFLEYNPEIKITLFDFDITNSKMIPFIKERYQTIHAIYHLAALNSPSTYKRFPLQTLDTEYIGTKNMLELAYFYKSRILLATTNDRNNKNIAEDLCYIYKNLYNVDTIIRKVSYEISYELNLDLDQYF